MNDHERLYGSAEADLEAAAGRLSTILGPGAAHESLYRGGNYYRWPAAEIHVVLQHNRELEDELAEPDFPGSLLLIRVEGSSGIRDWDSDLAGVGFRRLR